MSGPSTSSTGSYVLSWGASTGVVDDYVLYQNGVQILQSSVLSATVTASSDGTYSYHVQACNSAGCSAATPDFVVAVFLPPGIPGAINAPSETGPAYTVSWSAPGGPVDHYDFAEAANGGAWATSSLTSTAQSFTNKSYGTYSYQVRACNASGCSAYTAAASVTVITALTTFPDAPVVPPSVPVPPQGWVGTLPGTPAVEGGAATYRIPIEVPPGRLGMQPDLSLAYSSRNGNGIAGVGWSVTGLSTIYRCPRTLAQDDGNRPVQHDQKDRLCFDGQRLVGPADSSYGTGGSEYRTEADQFARITLIGGTGSWSSMFVVEHKSGHIAQYEPGPSPGSPFPPDVWYLVREFDRHNNCIVYNYATFASQGSDQDRELQSIVYTGTGDPSVRQCVTGADARTVEFSYTSDRGDKRTTFRFGVGSMMMARLAAISTKLGAGPIRRYELAYHPSAATQRSLLAGVTLCGGATCGVEKLPPITFSYQEDAPSSKMWHVQRAGQTLGPDWRIAFFGDLDGDGIRDREYIQDAGESDLELTTGCTAKMADLPLRWLGFAPDFDNTLVAGDVDFDNDGRVDLLGAATSGGILGFATLTCQGTTVNSRVTRTNYLLPLSDGLYVEGIDYDGDGIPDLLLGDATNPANVPPKVLLHRSKDPTQWCTDAADNCTVNTITTALPVAPVTGTPLGLKSMRDINGDGLVDSVFDVIPPSNTDCTQANRNCTQIAFFNGANAAYKYFGLPDVGGPVGSFNLIPTQGWIDVNGDGLPDIYEVGPQGATLYLNRGGEPGGGLFHQVVAPLTGLSAFDKRRLKHAFVMDIDGDGQDELLVPESRIIDYCGGNPTVRLPGGDPAFFCGQDFDSAPEEWESFDRSVFQWNAYKFVDAGNGQYSMVPVNPDAQGHPQPVLQAPINVPLAQIDFYGDGMTDVSYRLVNATFTVGGRTFRNYYQGLADPADLGPYISRNQMRAPDLMVGVKNGLGATASWKHRPLSDDLTTMDMALQWDSVGCDIPPGEKYYVAHHDDPHPLGHAYFTSSMWAVARFDVSNGIGTSANKSCYRYQDAMLNTEGRGFQGFRLITSEEQMPVATGEDATGVPPGGCGGTCSPNNLRTTSEFYQVFPLTSRLKTVTVAKTISAAPLRQTTYWWHQAQGSLGQTVVYSSGTLVREYDAGGPLAKQTASVSEVDIVSGEPVRTCAIVNGATPDPASGPRDVITRDTRTLFNDTSIWWLGRIDARELLSDFLAAPFSLPEACTVTGPGQCSPTPPTCPSLTPSASAKVKTTDYSWYLDNAATGARRRLQKEELTIHSAVESTNEYAYDQFGNLFTKQITARDIDTGPTFPPPDRGTVTLLPPTSYGYSADGYFQTSVTDSLNHTSSQIIDAGTGLITRSQAIPGGPVTAYTYDSLGRLLTKSTDGMQPIQTRLSGCTVGTNCGVKKQIFQSGAPVMTQYLDRLGRVIATGTEGFDGHEIIAKIDYNERGIKVAEYPPLNTLGTPGQWDGATASAYPTKYSGGRTRAPAYQVSAAQRDRAVSIGQRRRHPDYQLQL
jgi:Salmonella virulence plasmid 65kDa B protein/FG-GAP-like repeat